MRGWGSRNNLININNMNKEQLKTEIEALINASQYEQAAQTVAKELGIKLTSKGSEFKKYFADDMQQRYVFKMCLQRGKKNYTFAFGQSINSGAEEPTMYDILSCLQKYEVGTFENFCANFGYYKYKDGSEDYFQSKKIYNAVLKEFEAMERLFTNEELEILAEIN